MTPKQSWVATLLFLSACVSRDYKILDPASYFPGESAGSPVTILKNDTPENLLENLKTSYNRRRYEIYEPLLAAGYRFYMNDRYFGEFNAAGNATPPDPAYWTAEIDSGGVLKAYYQSRDQDLRAVRNMFDRNGRAKDLELFFTALPIASTTGDTAHFLLSNILLRITLRDDASIHEASGAAELTLVKRADGLWGISIWKDRTNP